MTDEEKKYQKELEESGVDLEGIAPTDEKGESPEQKAEAEAKAQEEADAKAKEEADEAARKEAEDAKSKENEPPRQDKKRSIYDDYKDKKKELKTAEERAEQAERERDELKAKIDALENATTPEEKKDALDEFDQFAKEIDADPEALKKMRDLFLKGVKVDESIQKDLFEFKEWKASQSKEADKADFENEFNTTLPVLKTFFPNANDKEMGEIKKELNKLAHTDGWNDKDLEYIAFKHKDILKNLVSPKKRGLEGRDNVDGDEQITTDFNPNPDFSIMSAKEIESWQKKYNEISKSSDGLTAGVDGKKMII